MGRLAKWIYSIFGKAFDKERTNRFVWMYLPFIVVFSVVLSLTATVFSLAYEKLWLPPLVFLYAFFVCMSVLLGMFAFFSGIQLILRTIINILFLPFRPRR
jgi:hypothetical protein